MKILLVEDEEMLNGITAKYLRAENMTVDTCFNGQQAIDYVNTSRHDVIVMDIMMPKMDGTRATLKIREEKEIPIIMLSAKSEDTDKILGLNIGADDYVTKPFNPLELIAGVNSQIRRYTRFSPLKENNDVIKIGAIELNKRSKVVLRDGEIAKLTPLEFKILSLLMDNPGRVFSIEEIYERVWNEVAFNVGTVTVHIRRIREKIEINPKEPRYLKVVWGIGYKFEKDHRG